MSTCLDATQFLGIDIPLLVATYCSTVIFLHPLTFTDQFWCQRDLLKQGSNKTNAPMQNHVP